MKRSLLIICGLILAVLVCGCTSTKTNVISTPTTSPVNGTVPQQHYANGTYVAPPMILDVHSTMISVSPNPGIGGQNMTVSGQNFTPNGTASLYGLPNEVYTANVDENGNTSWSFVANVWFDNYQIYALDGNYTNTKSNTITLNVHPNYYSTPPPQSSSPSIWVNPNPVSVGQNVTISGQNFTPNGIAVLSLNNLTANVDENGNTSWSFTNGALAPYSIYALDGNSTGRKSNTITIYPILNDQPPIMLNDWTPTPTPTPAPSPFPSGLCVLLTVCVAALISMCKKRS